MTAQILTQARLRELLHYNPETGEFTWLVASMRREKGSKAGCLLTRGYVDIGIGNKIYRAHRLAWLYVYGEWPTQWVDHVNGIKNDNRIINLRAANKKQNAENTTKQKRNTSGHKGVTWDSFTSNWKAQICHNGKHHNLGRFADVDDAKKAYLTAANQLFTHTDRIFKE